MWLVLEAGDTGVSICLAFRVEYFSRFSIVIPETSSSDICESGSTGKTLGSISSYVYCVELSHELLVWFCGQQLLFTRTPVFQQQTIPSTFQRQLTFTRNRKE